MNRPADNADLNLELPTRDTAAQAEAPAVPRADMPTAAFTPGDTVTTPIRAAPAKECFGRYLLVRLLGTGGMGDVHLAHDSLLERSVALKIPKFADDNPLHRQRFLREAKSAALLSHANICPVYDVGEVDGKPYLTMAYVDGPPLSARLRKEGPLEPHDAARLIAKVAHAMHHAHQNGIVHRDLKPGNILIDPQGEPIVMDFGPGVPLRRRNQRSPDGAGLGRRHAGLHAARADQRPASHAGRGHLQSRRRAL